MASVLSVFNPSDINVMRLRKMCELGSTTALRQLLRWVNPKWNPPESFKDYLKKQKIVSMKALNSILIPHQRVALRTDGTGETYDISLLYTLLLWGNEGLAGKDDKVWKEKSGCLEYLITAVKDVRNDLMHRYVPIEAPEFLERTEALRNLLKNMMVAAGTRYKHITQTDLDGILHKINHLMNNIRDDPLEPKDFEEYKKQLIFPQQCEFLKKEGAKALRMRHSKYSTLTPVSRLAEVNFPVDNVFTNMVLEKGSDNKQKLEWQDLIEAGNKGITDEAVFIEGDAGVGKTTLTKKLLSEWTSEKGNVKYLNTYDLVFHVECREHIDSFKALMESSLMDVSQSFQGEDIVYVTLGLKVLIIIDGLDELNKKSTNLFKDILQMKKDHNITVLITSRPEASEKYFQHARSYQVQTKYVKLLGIPFEKREEFLQKYYAGLKMKGLVSHEIEGLLQYFKRTELRLSYLWRLPYNLTILTILWALKPDIVNSITTAPELHWEIHQLLLSKLQDRLSDSESAQHLSSSVLARKTDRFIYSLCRESLIALAHDDVTLPQIAYQRLVTVCHEIEIPVEEMTGSFLKKITSVTCTRYSFPHKGLQDFLAALFIWIQLTASPVSADVMNVVKGIEDVLSQFAVPVSVCRNITKHAAGELKRAMLPNCKKNLPNFNAQWVEKQINNIMEENQIPDDISQDILFFAHKRLNKTESDEDLSIASLTKDRVITKIIQEEIGEKGFLDDKSKYQNMFISLIGIFSLDNANTIEEETIMEVLLLLEETGVKAREGWLAILNSVKCNKTVASFIGKQQSLFESDIIVNDSNVFAYITLLQTLAQELDNINEISVTVNVKGDLGGVDELMKLISIHPFKKRQFVIDGGDIDERIEFIHSIKKTLDNPHEIDAILHIHDSNIKDCHRWLRKMRKIPHPLRLDAEISVDIGIRDDLGCHCDLLSLVNKCQLKVKQILITDENISDYIEALKALKSPMKDAEQIHIKFIDLYEDLRFVSDLFKVIKSHRFVVSKWEKESQPMVINNGNFEYYYNALTSFPRFLKDAFNGSFKLKINDQSPDIDGLLEEIIRTQLKIEIEYLQEFRHPKTVSALKESATELIQRCAVERYVGSLTSTLVLPSTVKELYVGIADSTYYRSLLQHLNSNSHVEILGIVLSCQFDSSHLEPLPDLEFQVAVNLYVTDVTSPEYAEKASQIIKCIQPTSGGMTFSNIYFPRAELSFEEIANFIQCMEGIKVAHRLGFPYRCGGDRFNETEFLSRLAMTLLLCTDYIHWDDGQVEYDEMTDLSEFEK